MNKLMSHLDLEFTEVTSRQSDRGEPVPLSFDFAGDKVPVRRITDRWFGRDHCYFKVVSHDENVFLLRYDQIALVWECRALNV